MGSGASTIAQNAFSKADLERIVETAFRGGAQTVSLSELLRIANEGGTNQGIEKEEVPSDVPDIKSTTKKVFDKRGKQLTLSQQTTQRIREIFDKMDENEDKIVKRDEFLSAVTQNDTMTEEDAKLLFAEIDVSRTGRITIAKFQQYSVVASIHLMRKHFSEMDDSKDRQIQEKEFKNFFTQRNSTKRTDQLWNKLDKNKNGKVNFKEWKVWAEDVCARDNLELVFGTDIS